MFIVIARFDNVYVHNKYKYKQDDSFIVLHKEFHNKIKTLYITLNNLTGAFQLNNKTFNYRTLLKLILKIIP